MAFADEHRYAQRNLLLAQGFEQLVQGFGGEHEIRLIAAAHRRD